ncbi:MAG: UDP-N-acetylmuramate dehydrogenase [Verrucomicrobia bacterium]|nr:UDP-N-acetylmuramate dehydrogenase [Verrucomicrobiota bacterium]
MMSELSILNEPGRVEEHFADDLARQLSPEAVVRRHEPLDRRTTLRVGGPADLFVVPANESDLASTLAFCRERALQFFVLGRGSNLLVRDGGFRGVVIALAHPHFSRITVEPSGVTPGTCAEDLPSGATSPLGVPDDPVPTPQGRLRCGAGAKLKQVAIEARRHGLSGVEFLEGIPGSVGGALRMNAGAMGSWTFNVVESVRVMDRDGRVSVLPAGDIPVEYRHCPLFKSYLALEAVFRCRRAPRDEIEQRMNTFSQKRWASQPAAPSAGCLFKNPPSIPAGKLIDELGLKGTRIGGAVVSAEHGNFIVNTGSATARDVLELIAIIQARARDERGVVLETEVEIIGESETLQLGGM